MPHADCNNLRTGYTSEIDGNSWGPAAAAAGNRSRARNRRVSESNRSAEGKDHLMIAIRAAAATFDAGIARER